MRKETLFHTPMTPPEKEHIRSTALWMFGLTLVGGLLIAWLTPKWDEICAQSYVEMLILGAILMVAAIPLHVLAGSRRMKKRKWRRVFYMGAILNVLGVSLFEAAYYTRIGVAPLDVEELFRAAVLPLFFGFLCMACFVLFTNAIAALPLIQGGVGLVGIVICIVFWVKAGHTKDAVFWSFMLFTLVSVLIVLIAFVFAAGEVSELYGGTDAELTEANAEAPAADAMPDRSAGMVEAAEHVDADGDNSDEADRRADAGWGWLRFLSFASFGVFMLVGAVVLLILMCLGGDCDCDCDCCSGCDCGGSGSGGKSKVNRRIRRH